MDFLTLINDLKYLRNRPSQGHTYLLSFLEKLILLCKASAGTILSFDSSSGWKVIVQSNLEDPTPILQIAQRAYSSGQAFEKLDVTVGKISRPLVVSLKLDGDSALVVCLLADRQNSLPIQELLLRLQLVSDIPVLAQKTSTNHTNNPAFDTILSLLSKIVDQNEFQLACMILVNEVCSRFQSARVSFGINLRGYCETIAISHLEKFQKNTDASLELIGVMEECADQNAEIHFPSSANETLITVCHDRYQRQQGMTEILSLPLRTNDKVWAVLVLENLRGLSETELITLRFLSNQISPILLKQHQDSLGFMARLLFKLRNWAAWWLGVEKTFTKLLIIVFSILTIYICTGTWDYKIEVFANLVTDEVSYVSAPYDGIVFSVSAKAGDLVKKGDVLLTLDTQDLFLKRAESEAEITRYQRETQKARADGRLADMNIAQARLEQALAELDRVNYYINIATLKAPRDGIIIQGDTKSLLGAPITKGTSIFQIANPVDLYVELKVPERDVAKIQIGDIGQLALLSNPSQKYDFVIENLIPVATVDGSNGNIFFLKARINNEAELWWRPGMSGTAKIDAGTKNILWILTHRIQDTLSLYLWW